MASIKGYALVTGGTSGIGYELAKLLAADAYDIILVARGEEGLEEAAKGLQRIYPVKVVTIAKDLSVPENAGALVEELRSEAYPITVLVNDAGQGLYGEFMFTDLNRELSIVQLNICAMLILTKYCLKEMAARSSGKILNVASVAGKVPGPLQSVYHGTKAFVHSFTEAIRAETRETGVTVTSLLPGATDTDFFRKAGMLDSKIVQKGDLADPAKVAKDGYEALKGDKDMVISGFGNKAQVAMSNVLPDSLVAEHILKEQAPMDPEQ